MLEARFGRMAGRRVTMRNPGNCRRILMGHRSSRHRPI
jgi:hypothetical protein